MRRMTLFLCLLGLAFVPAGAAPRALVLATTTSTEDTGLLEALLPRFERQTGLKVKVIAVGTGQALELGRRGDADVLMVHAPEAEKAFVAEGHGIDRRELFYNDFVLVGPAADPARVRGSRSAAAALKAIAAAGARFASRGDDSGTHKKELSLWRQAGLQPRGRWYLSVGSGMAETLRFAGEQSAYTLADRGTWLVLGKSLPLRVLFKGDPQLRNVYSVMAVNPRRHPHVRREEARRLTRFLLHPDTRKQIARFGKERFGQALFRLLPPPKSIPASG